MKDLDVASPTDNRSESQLAPANNTCMPFPVSFSFGWEPKSKARPESIASLLKNALENSFNFLSVPLSCSSEDAAAWSDGLVALSEDDLEFDEWSRRILFRVSWKAKFRMQLLGYAQYLGAFGVLVEEWMEADVQGIVSELESLGTYGPAIYFRCKAADRVHWSVLNVSELTRLYGRIGVVLEIPHCESYLDSGWKSELVKGIIVPESLFIPSLPRNVQVFIDDLYRAGNAVPIIISGIRPSALDADRLRASIQTGRVGSEEQFILLPLQPSRDNLSAEIYATFEQDTVKYDAYERAIAEGLRYLDEKGMEANVAVFGAGRGPLVERTLKALHSASIESYSILAVEKNPFAFRSLSQRFQGQERIRLHCGFMDQLTEEEIREHGGPFSLIISELLGSFGDNELAPECLWPVEGFLAQGGLCIPRSYTSYLLPAYCPRLELGIAQLKDSAEYSNPFERAYVVKTPHSFFPLAASMAQSVFTFIHPCIDEYQKDEELCRTLQFPLDSAPADASPAVANGLMGYFHCELVASGDEPIVLSTVPGREVEGLRSWFPMFFPLKKHISFSSRNPLRVQFKRKRNGDGRVWYEWSVQGLNEPFSLEHNLDGKSFSFNLK